MTEQDRQSVSTTAADPHGPLRGQAPDDRAELTSQRVVETGGKLTREDIAKIEIGHTNLTRPMAWVLVLVFMGTIFVEPAFQHFHEIGQYLRGDRPSPWPQAYEVFAALPRAARVAVQASGNLGRTLFAVVAAVSIGTGLLVVVLFRRMLSGAVMAVPGLIMLGLLPFVQTHALDLMAANSSMAREIKQYEDTLKEDSLLGSLVLPPAQRALTALGVGNEKAYVGRDGWLFYRPEIDYLTNAGFLQPAQLAKRADSNAEWEPAIQSDPCKAIIDFKGQLARRGIRLIVMPVPAKSMIHPEKFSSRYEGCSDVLQNPSYEAFKSRMAQAAVEVCDVSATLLAMRRQGREVFLKTDTHWRPEAMEAAVGQLKALIDAGAALPAPPPPGLRRQQVQFSNLGDIAVMLKLPKDQKVYDDESVAVQQVVNERHELWRPSRSADVVVLGDSFSNIYSLESMGWGESGGLVEQLSFLLQRPVDCLLRNAAGAHAARQMLASELAAGRDRLAGKKLLVWQFAIRELSEGNWKLLDMTLGQPRPSRFIVPPPGGEMVVTGTIQAASAAPKPSSVTYADHIVTVHLVDLRTPDGAIEGGEAIVRMQSMKDAVWTAAARYRPGQTITVRLEPWEKVAEAYDRINRSELDDEALQLEEFCWGEPVK